MHKTRNKRKQLFIALGFVAPFFILYTVFTIWPVVQGVYVSLHKWTLMGKLKFVGLDNYLKFIGDKKLLGSASEYYGICADHCTASGDYCYGSGTAGKPPYQDKKRPQNLLLSAKCPFRFGGGIYCKIYVRTIQGVYQWISSCHRSSGGKPGTPVAAGWKPGLGDDYIHDGMVDSRIQYDALSVSVTGYFAPGV